MVQMLALKGAANRDSLVPVAADEVTAHHAQRPGATASVAADPPSALGRGAVAAGTRGPAPVTPCQPAPSWGSANGRGEVLFPLGGRGRASDGRGLRISGRRAPSFSLVQPQPLRLVLVHRLQPIPSVRSLSAWNIYSCFCFHERNELNHH